jgi:hypothetical protein
MSDMARIEPLQPQDFPPEMRAALAALRPPNPRHEPMPTADRPKALKVLGTMAHHPALAQAYFTLNGHLLRATTLTERQRELGTQELLDLIFTVGSYDTLAGMTSSLELGIDDDIRDLVQSYDQLF